MIEPNFFIVGAPKCGTTALSEYLRTHPSIFISQFKEPHYFAEDFPKYRSVDSLDAYLALFRESTEEHLVVGEASVWYLYSSVAISNIHEFNPHAKIIVMLRNPVDLVYSLHSQLLYTFDENEKDFEVAWRLQASRRMGRNISTICREPSLLQYAQVGRLGAQVERLFGIFSPIQVKAILFDDFTASTSSVYQGVLSFLEVPFDGRTDFPVINENKTHKWRWLGKLLRILPRFLYTYAHSIESLIGIEPIGRKIIEMNRRTMERRPLPLTFRRELLEEFREDVEKLSGLINRDLSSWYV